ncbi:hypothetical protein BSKO_07244 [Bryopsis sp. KO-2023]|nr:hypothetical protein BSKO_07244 [Bryopsis sp. KO-2023]
MGKGLRATEAKLLIAVAAMFSVMIIRARAQQEVMVSPIVTMVSCETRDFMEEDLEARRFRTLTRRAFVYNGSPLNNGRESITSTDRECLGLCAKTPGCRAWTRNTKSPSKGECWLHAALPEPRQSPNQNSGRVQLKEATLASCEGMKSVGFQRAVAYAILNTVSAGECCARCREDSKLCHAWMFVKSEKGCHLFGNEVPTAKEIPCKDCTSGRRKIVKACGGPPSTEKQCRFEKGIETFGGDAYVENHWIPSGKRLKTPTPGGCCAVCEGMPECTTWTFTRGKPGQLPFGCWIKFDVPGAQNIKAEEFFNQSVSGVVPSRLSSTQLKEFDTAVEEARKNAKHANHENLDQKKSGKKGKKWILMAVMLGVVGVVLCLLCCVIAYTCHVYRKRKRREKIAKQQHMQMAHHMPHMIETLPTGGAAGGPPSAIQPYVAPGAASVAVTIGKPAQPVISYAGGAPLSSHVAAGGGGLVTNLSVGGASLATRACGGGPSLVRYVSSAAQSVGASSQGRSSPVASEERVTVAMPEVIEEEEEEEEGGKESAYRMKVELLEGLKGRGGTYFGQDQEEFPGEDINQALMELGIGDRLGGKYVFEGEIRLGKTSIVVDARQRIGQATPVIIKFFRSLAAFEREAKFFSQKIVSPRIPQVLDIFAEEEAQFWGLPPTPCVVMERGDFTLAQFLESKVSVLDPLDQSSILYKICLALDVLHQHGIAHRNLTPQNVVMFSSSLSWKLIDYSFSSKKGRSSPIVYSLTSCSPEMLTAHAKGHTHIFAKLSVDMWSLGLIFWEVLTGFPLFGRQFSKDEVMSMLLGVTPLPFEKDPELWDNIKNTAARRIVQNLLIRSPNARWPIQKVLSNSFFSSGEDTVQEERSVSRSNVKLKGIAESVNTVEEKLEKMVEVAIEEIKLNVGAVVIMCCSFFEISPSEFLSKTPTEKELINGYKKGTLDVTEALTAVNFNPLKEYKKEPRPLLRLERNHIVRITLLYGASMGMELPISEILSCRIEPTHAPTDARQVQISPVHKKGHILDGVGYWETTSHKDSSLKVVGDRSIDLVLDVRIKSTGDVLQIRKTIDIQMRRSDDQMKSVVRFNHAKQWFQDLPSWAKIYIHGAVFVWRRIRV